MESPTSVTAISQTGRQRLPEISESWHGHQISSFSSFAKQSIPWVLAVIGILAITQYALRTYQLQQPVECDLGSTPDGQKITHQALALRVQQEGRAKDQYCLARTFEEGIGVNQSKPEAIKLYAEAAKEGLLSAKNVLCDDWLLFQGVVLTNEKVKYYETLGHIDFLWFKYPRDCGAPGAATIV